MRAVKRILLNLAGMMGRARRDMVASSWIFAARLGGRRGQAMVPRAASPRRAAVLFRTHFWDAACDREYLALRRDLPASYDIVVTGYVAEPASLVLPPHVARCLLGDGDMAGFGYPAVAALTPHHLDAMRFFRAHPDYDDYWMIEYDVRYTGSWRALFDGLSGSPADLLATVVQRRRENPQWLYWSDLHVGGAALKGRQMVKAFLPLARVSNAGMRAIDAAYRAGWHGHNEVLWPSALAAAGLVVEEIGGKGAFTPRARYGRYYTNARLDPYLSPGSFVFRPAFQEEALPASPPQLWHPVKPAALLAQWPLKPGAV